MYFSQRALGPRGIALDHEGLLGHRRRLVVRRVLTYGFKV
jgi:hypothetical protein